MTPKNPKASFAGTKRLTRLAFWKRMKEKYWLKRNNRIGKEIMFYLSSLTYIFAGG
jgi:hypothetical protein